MIQSTKQSLRSHFQNERDRLTAAYRKNASQVIQTKLLALLKQHSSTNKAQTKIAFYYEHGSEVILSSIFPQLTNYPLYLPFYRQSWQMANFEFPTEFSRNYYGIHQPRLPKAIFNNLNHAEFSQTDIVIVPGLAFTPQGHRLGSGQGIYDRWLASTSAIKIGISFDCQIIESLPIEEHDVPMDIILTEKYL